MTELDYKKWTDFRETKKTSINQNEFEYVCDLHARLFNHKFYKPCTCRPKEINKMIKDINEVYATI